jgi:hypothetical protein
MNPRVGAAIFQIGSQQRSQPSDFLCGPTFSLYEILEVCSHCSSAARFSS